MADEDDPRDFSLYGGPMREYGRRSGLAAREQLWQSLLMDSKPCKKMKTRTGKEVKLPAIVALTALDLDLLQRALSGYLRETMQNPRHKQDRLEDHIEMLMARLKAMEGEP